MSEQPLQLPKNRFEVFRYFVLQWDKMLSLSLLTALFALPLFALLAFSSFAEASLANQNLDQAEYVARLMQLKTAVGVFSVAGFYPLMTALNGDFLYMRKIAWGQGANIKSDFFDGVKSSFGASVLQAIFAALCFLFWQTAVWFARLTVTQIGWKIALYVSIAAVTALVCAAVMFDLAQNAVYKTSAFQRVKNAFILAFAQFPRNFAIVAATFLPFVFAEVWTVLGTAIAVTVFSLYWFAAGALAQTLYCHGVFDRYINRKRYPELVDRGLTKNKGDNK